MSEKYDHLKIEKKWQAQWESAGMYQADNNSDKPKKYVLDMFPYPSGDGLHLGHVENYTATCIYSRYLRMKGFNVMHPIGWDAFGLPSENYAIKTGTHPDIRTHQNINNFIGQMKSLGFSSDWTREIDTSSPEYYKWTQWFFLLLYKNGLAYKKKAKVNWCESCKTVLANEQAENGICERCKNEVVQKDLEQWFFKITDYADELIDDLGKVDWPSSTVSAQRNWIGRSEGVEFTMPVLSKNKKALIIHGFDGDPSHGWKPWLKSTLEMAGFEVRLPKLPNTKHPDFDETMAFLEKETVDFGDNDIIIGHSLGAQFALKLAEKKEFAKIILVAPAIGGFEYPYDDWKKNDPGDDYDACQRVLDGHHVDFLKVQAKEKVAIFGTNDRGIPLKHADQLGNDWNVIKLEGVHHMSHQESIPEILEAVTSLIKVYTTRIDTVFGMTYVVLAPEHPLIQKLSSLIKNTDEVNAYIEVTKKKTELERTELAKDKTGVKLEGVLAINPFTKESVPVFIGDYVLGNYGTGAVMAVPAHDERDFEFAKKFGLPIIQTIKPTGEQLMGVGVLFETKEGKFILQERDEHAPTRPNMIAPFGGGRHEGESDVDCALREIAEEVELTLQKEDLIFIGTIESNNFPGKYLSIFHAKGIDPTKIIVHEGKGFVELSDEEVFAHEKVTFFTQNAVRALRSGFVAPFVGSGCLFNSGEFNDLTSEEAREKMAMWLTAQGVGAKKVNYRLRDWLVSRQRYWGAPIPIIYCDDCGEVPVPEENLPVLLPTDVDFRPTGESPLKYSKTFNDVVCPTCKKPARREADTMDTFVCSSWYYFRFADPKNKKEFASREAIERWLPVDMYMGGAEHTVLHLMYARFFTKVLKKLGYINFDEPFSKLRHQGMILAEDGRKMSKSLGNVINPNEIIAEYGADTLRLHEMFLGPLEDMKAWNSTTIIGLRRFLERVWKLKEKVSNTAVLKDEAIVHKTIQKVGEDIEEFGFNTAISSMMILVNEMEKLDEVSKEAYETLLLLLAPFAPHITEELWREIGNNESIHLAKWPSFDPSKCVASEVTIAIQVGGKLRDTIVVPAEAVEEAIKELALARPAILKWVDGNTIIKIIYVKGRLINIVV